MVTVQYAKAFPDIRVNAVEPGYTRDRPKRSHRPPDRGAGRGDHRPDGGGGPGRADRGLLRRPVTDGRAVRPGARQEASPGRPGQEYAASSAGVWSR
ncbi:hypothetical protein GCM10010360_26950 [Streptomyces nogalater]